MVVAGERTVPPTPSLHDHHARRFRAEQGEWLHGKAHGAGVSTSSPGGTPSLVRYQNGTLVRSEPYDPAAHEDLRTRVEELALAAIGVAVLTRRAAAAIQGAEIPPPMPGLEETERLALREAGAQIAGASILSKALLVLTGLHTAVQACRPPSPQTMLL